MVVHPRLEAGHRVILDDVATPDLVRADAAVVTALRRREAAHRPAVRAAVLEERVLLLEAEQGLVLLVLLGGAGGGGLATTATAALLGLGFGFQLGVDGRRLTFGLNTTLGRFGFGESLPLGLFRPNQFGRPATSGPASDNTSRTMSQSSALA